MYYCTYKIITYFKWEKNEVAGKQVSKNATLLKKEENIIQCATEMCYWFNLIHSFLPHIILLIYLPQFPFNWLENMKEKKAYFN